MGGDPYNMQTGGSGMMPGGMGGFPGMGMGGMPNFGAMGMPTAGGFGAMGIGIQPNPAFTVTRDGKAFRS